MQTETETAYANTITLVATITDYEEGRIAARRLDGYVASSGDLVLHLDGLSEVEQKSAMTTDLATIDPAVRALQIGLERIGWTIVAAEIDLTREAARIEVKRTDGRYITFDARNGRSTITREHMGYRNVHIKQVRGGYISERIEMTFLGRTRHEGARSGLRALCSYVADNATAPTAAIDVRRLFSLVMDGHRHAITAG